MSFTMANRGLYTLLNAAISGSTDIRVAVFKGSAPAASAIKDYNFLSDVTGAMTEAAASGYSRADLAGVTLTENDGSDNVTLTATAPSWTSVAVGETWTALAYYIEDASDAARTLIGVDVPSATLVTNGGNVTGPALSITLAGS